ncbi:ribosomal protein L11 [Cryptococcus gattii Ru294]|uniref:Large ribosomal subunit protein uL11m n=2 Tax=Cryptococcus gattii TaxID=37769 RepID=E6R107_CRYGW|nr:60S ribosomal protein l19, mitochondrial precursor, putative [Cryptococcus gattii WM276]KIR53233.1 ribosomal protein L11 [Cryptococcus gattii Ru294]KIR76886.1 ribosomal protein L11 [Cryptococcus gattii EJB2]KIY31378.1 ribosomal protein L11 [Cryptococcus gattii E566]KJE00188.1 ribosomal protein L11 [Cryptococcus gattii NT-10]ADV20498.1 60S ribosomal protein l19, mitochondrial precursor, putative [Cryptococcus gattii WM276]
MSKAVAAQIVKIIVPAGKAAPTPPVGPALGARGVKAMDFCKEFNAKTAHYQTSLPIPTMITINPDRTFSFATRTPPVSYLLKKTTGIDKGSGQGMKVKTGQVSLKHVYEIAKIKCMDEDLKAAGLERVARGIVGTAKSLGLEVVP